MSASQKAPLHCYHFIVLKPNRPKPLSNYLHLVFINRDQDVIIYYGSSSRDLIYKRTPLSWQQDLWLD